MKCAYCKKREGFKKEGYEFNICKYCWDTWPGTQVRLKEVK